MKRSKFSETQIIAILNEADAGLSVKEIRPVRLALTERSYVFLWLKRPKY